MKRVIIVIVSVLMMIFLTACSFVDISSDDDGGGLKPTKITQGETVSPVDVSLSGASIPSNTETLICIVEDKCYSPSWNKYRLVMRGYSTVSSKEVERYITTDPSACFVFDEGVPVQICGAVVDRSRLDDKYGAYVIENYDSIQRYDRKGISEE